MVSKQKRKKQVPKLENVGKLLLATLIVPTLSSLLMYGFGVLFLKATPPKPVEATATMAENQPLDPSRSNLK